MSIITRDAVVLRVANMLALIPEVTVILSMQDLTMVLMMLKKKSRKKETNILQIVRRSQAIAIQGLIKIRITMANIKAIQLRGKTDKVPINSELAKSNTTMISHKISMQCLFTFIMVKRAKNTLLTIRELF